MSESTLNISELTIEQRTLLEQRLRQKREGRHLADRIMPRGDASPAPLSFAQQRLWFLHQLDPDSALYNCASAVRLDGELNVPALERAVGEIVARHEALRTTFETRGGETLQVSAPASPMRLNVLDLCALAETEREAEARRIVTEEARRPFDLARGPLLRLNLLRLEPHRHVLGLTLHHIIADGWSLGVLVTELTALYGAYMQGLSSPLPPLPVQYADYARWQRDWLSGQRLESELSYWRRHLEGAPLALGLPTDRPRSVTGAYRGGRHRLEVSGEIAGRLKALAHGEGATLFMALMAAWRVLLWRHSGERDVVVGTPVAGRQRGEVEGLIGFFVNTLAVRVEVRAGEGFRGLLRREREGCVGAFEHQGVAFEKVVEELRPERSLSHTPIFQAVFALQNSPAPSINLAGLIVSQQELATNVSKFDIALTLTEKAQRLNGFIEYSTELFDASTIERLAARFLTLLEGIVADPGRRVEELPLLPAAERRLLLHDWNDTAAPYSTERFVHQMFEAQTARDPDALALVAGDARLTYGELNARANRLAHYLRSRGVGPDVLVGLCVERSAEWVTGWLGVLKAGGAPVSIDPTYPPARVSLMVEDARVRLLLTARGAPIPAGGDCEVVRLDSDWERIARESERNPASSVSEQNLAYVIYTSGSTGRPKGVAATHGSLVNLVTWHTRLYKVTPADRAAQLARMAFDASVLEMWPIFWAGASLHLIDEETRLSPQGIREWLVANEITFCHLPPALSEPILFDEWPEQTRLRMMLTGADRLRLHPPESLPFEYANHYGPTETTVLVTSCRVPPRENADVAPHIGRPIANTQVYLLDQRLQLVPIGVVGELYAGGDGITRGYFHDPKLTAERFVPDPFSGREGARLYRTGDLARHLADGRIEFLGRADNQVKLRGHRIELGEVETALAAHPSVERAVVEVREAAGGDRRLVAYLLGGGGDAGWEEVREQVRSLVARRLPDYMVPAAYVRLEALPLTANGKVDRRALPEPDWTQTRTSAEFVPPRNDLERQLAGMFSELLGVGDVGVHHDFFELGGHSLLATQFTARARAACGVELPLRLFFEAPTVAGVAAYIERQGSPARDFDVTEIKAAARGDKSLDELLAELDAMSGEEAQALLSDGEPSAHDASRG